MAAAKLKSHIQEREALKDTIKYLQDEITTHATTAMDEFTVDQHLETAAGIKADLILVHKKIMLDSPTDPDVHAIAYHTLLKNATTVYSQLHGIKIKFPTQPPLAPPHSSQADVRLPRLELPTFDGDLNKWVSFRDMFTTTIHKNMQLSKSQKLTYLKSALRDEAARLVQTLIITDANYDIAWDQLTSRYQNDREILFALLRKFSNQAILPGNSSTAIRNLIDVSIECKRSLEVIGLTIDPAMDAFMMFHVVNKLDTTSRELWEQGLKDSSIPKLESLFNFLEQRARALAAGESCSVFITSGAVADKRPRAHHTHSTSRCNFCKEKDHYITRCSSFLSKAPNQRYDTIKKLNLCFNCLREGHTTVNCTNMGRCRTCERKHHTLIHPTAPGRDEQSNQDKSKSTQSHHTDQGMSDIEPAMLATAIVKVKDIHGQAQLCRVLLDGCSTNSYITESCAQRLQLQRRKSNTQIIGLSSVPVGNARGVVTLEITPYFKSNTRYSIDAFIITKVSSLQPTYSRDDSSWNHLHGLQLADPHYNKPRHCDILVGADIFFATILNGQRRGPQGTPFAINTTFGWIIGGPTANKQIKPSQVRTHHTLQELMEKFWSLQEVPTTQAPTAEEAACEKNFKETVSRSVDGRFIVRYPWKTPTPPLGPTKEMSMRRLKTLEKRLESQPHLYEQYIAFFKDYEAQGHMKLIQNAQDLQDPNAVYIPHHYVLKDSSTTTKYRSVFDASAKTSTGHSLNSTMMVGPEIQAPLLDTLLRFRLHETAFLADIEKMYRQILVTPEDAVKQRILFREKPTDNINTYQLSTITYGTAAAPYLATRVLRELADQGEEKYPVGSRTVRNHLYMDDLMHGARDTDEALKIYEETTELLNSAGFSLRKWASNNKEFLSHLLEHQKETNSTTALELGQTVKALGISWNTTTDSFHFLLRLEDTPGAPTKRTTLSYIAKIYDPLGWLAPLLVVGKIFLQGLWLAELDWDTPLPPHLLTQWDNFKEQLKELCKITIPRCIKSGLPYFIGLAAFSDASMTAYCAVCYLCCYYHNQPPSIRIIAAKTRVAPTKTVTLPKLELCAALEVSTLVTIIKTALKIQFDSIRAWSDSTVALCWIQSSPSRWKQFVSHRVAEIQQNVPEDCWRHVSSEDNPADCGSRGISIHELIAHPLWWEEPSWLKDIDSMNTTSTSYKEYLSDENVQKEERKQTTTHFTITPDHSLLQQFSSLRKLLRSTAWLRRYMSFLKSKSNGTTPTTGPLTPVEIQDAHKIWIIKTQEESFPDEMKILNTQQQLPSRSKILALSPFIDKHGQLRVGGRLRHAPITPDMKTPLLLPRHHPLTKLIINSKHMELLHAGPQLLQSAIQQQYWIIRVRDAIRQVVRSCTTCVRHRATTLGNMMGDLPSTRVTPAPPFQKCGLDYAGPFTTRSIHGKSKVTFKSYLCIFVCFVTHAVHLEVVSSMTTKGFLAALKRFTARRGIPTDLFSDCGSNFIGGNKELKEFSKSVATSSNTIKEQLSAQSINWHFNPPAAPHFGGLWEAAVKSVKFHLYRVIGAVRLTFEELTTIMIQIEACLNSRPLTPMSADPNDMTALTPGHFLIGQPLTAIPEPDLTDLKIGRLDRWQMMTHLTQHFWKRWVNEYLSTLQKRTKWTSQKKNIEVNDMVLVKHENTPPLHWKLGRVIALHPGQDNIVRVVTVRTAEGEFKRPIVKLCILPVESEF